MFTPIDPESVIRWFAVKNDSNEEVPPYGVMRITGYDVGEGWATVNKPNSDSQSLICFNGPIAIPASERGVATVDLPCKIAYHEADGTPGIASPPQAWGSGNGNWKLRKDNTGVWAWGGAENGIAVFGRAAVIDVECVDNNIVVTYGVG